MDLKELIYYRTEVLDEARDSEGYISEAGFIDSCLPWLNETKHIDTTDVTNVYDPLENGTIKVNAYVCNESGERLQLFIVNEESLNPDSTDNQLLVSQKSVYEKCFTKAIAFVKKSIKKQIQEYMQDGSPAWMLVHQLGNNEFIDQIDVIEIFLLSATASIESRGATPTAKMLEFNHDSIKVTYSYNGKHNSKDITIQKHLIDLNYLYNVHIAQGSRYPLEIDFTEAPYNHPLPFLHAASEKHFDSYLCALPANLLSELYKNHSSRLLEKNVRSFLQLKGVNKGMQETIRKEPEKFIAYNNGLTITATAHELTTIDNVTYLKKLTDFQIVNGGQTTATLYFSKKQGLNIDSIKVMAKINVAKDASEEALDDLISNISTYSNAQSKVSKVDLRARSQQLVRLKSLSESVLSTSGKKWFFERAKGEYATMVRINSEKKSQIEKTFPQDRRFTKEELAKYYSAWGDKPYAVKKGGEKIFRLFLEEISGEGSIKKEATINRSFYEDLIARIILFRGLEKIYGSGNGSLGQLRSAVVPYSLSALYSVTKGDKKSQPFDLLRIWKEEKIDDTLRGFFKDLMKLMNKLIKKYSKSDDLGEYSKKLELWEDISSSFELRDFMNEPGHKALIKQYSISPEELKRREKELSSKADIDFQPILQIAAIYDRGAVFYKTILSAEIEEITEAKQLKINTIIAGMREYKMVESNHLEFEKELISILSTKYRHLMPKKKQPDEYQNTVNFIIKKYNSAISNGKNIQATFDAIKEQAKKKGVKDFSVFGEIGNRLESETLPTINQIRLASEYCKTIDMQ